MTRAENPKQGVKKGKNKEGGGADESEEGEKRKKRPKIEVVSEYGNPRTQAEQLRKKDEES